MDDTHETIADIIAWLRRPIEGENAYLTLWRDEIAARIEVALRRDKAAIEADALAVGGIVEATRKRGDCAKLREALAKIRSEAYECDQGGEYLGEGPDPAFERIIKMCDAALATTSNQNAQED